MYPRLNIDLTKLKENLNAVSKITKQQGGCSMMIVTKGLCAEPGLANLLLSHPEVDFIADSRIQNIKTFAGCGKKTALLRLPMASEISDVVRYVDLSFNSELATIRLLDQEAERQGKVHDILLMIDLGDLREGIFYQDEDQIFAAVEECLASKHIRFYGVGVNLTCYGAVIPKEDNLSVLVETARKIEEKFKIQLKMVSGGNSSSIYLAERGELPKGINNLRLGEAFLLGNDTAYGTRLPGTVDDALILEAQIIELKHKRSLPIGEIGVDAFGQRPVYEDRGVIKRAILAIGKQDTDPESMIPLDKKIDILGASSDHLILDVSKSDRDYKVGDVISFRLGYSGMLKCATSRYVEKGYL
ncbi:alanine/ornithine racemase family PLP-dependent enzyme [Anoxybacterium hadale]|uniref:Alanine/ornithine racemase family PLP-dependent enzyme n=1 Tax=Anoxybacterium hadale TaxID=3408580 RepID=A0ACD1AE15_9FIRM|nr:alanine/ornithine racemase family PLP-dependent enzyme [Clostridiales bacterium]